MNWGRQCLTVLRIDLPKICQKVRVNVGPSIEYQKVLLLESKRSALKDFSPLSQAAASRMQRCLHHDESPFNPRYKTYHIILITAGQNQKSHDAPVLHRFCIGSWDATGVVLGSCKRDFATSGCTFGRVTLFSSRINLINSFRSWKYSWVCYNFSHWPQQLIYYKCFLYNLSFQLIIVFLYIKRYMIIPA